MSRRPVLSSECLNYRRVKLRVAALSHRLGCRADRASSSRGAVLMLGPLASSTKSALSKRAPLTSLYPAFRGELLRGVASCRVSVRSERSASCGCMRGDCFTAQRRGAREHRPRLRQDRRTDRGRGWRPSHGEPWRLCDHSLCARLLGIGRPRAHRRRPEMVALPSVARTDALRPESEGTEGQRGEEAERRSSRAAPATSAARCYPTELNR
jgi:hypothetical protein